MHGTAAKCVCKICQNIYERKALRNEKILLHKILIFLLAAARADGGICFQWQHMENLISMNGKMNLSRFLIFQQRKKPRSEIYEFLNHE